ncbi:MAG: hypothetical protein SGJ10_13690 [Bacteroidota bacterium]|nr:hypothetical protein [Bacteroidota bacterium]
MQKTILIFTLLLAGMACKAQERGQPQFDSLYDAEIQLEGLSHYFINDTSENVRLTTTYFFVKTLVKALKIEHSYFYPFDSLKAVSIQKPEDDKFRIFSWHLRMHNGSYRQYGVLQFNPEFIKTIKRKKKDANIPAYIPLIDRSDSLLTKDAEMAICGTEQWFGALYYKITTVKYKKQTYYMLLGLDKADSSCNRKIADVLTIDKKGKIILGAPVFKRLNDEKLKNRFILSYADDANIILRYTEASPGNFMIVFDNLIPSPTPIKGKNNLIPDGSFDGLKWEKGLWQHKEIGDMDGIKTKGEPGKTR